MEHVAKEFADSINKVLNGKGRAEVADDFSQVGGGSLPGVEIPTKAVALNLYGHTAQEVSDMLRKTAVPIIGRIYKDKFMLDLRTMSRRDIDKPSS